MAAKFPDYLLPLLRVLAYTVCQDPIECQPPYLQLAVMATEAVLIDEGGVRGSRASDTSGRWLLCVSGEAGRHQHERQPPGHRSHETPRHRKPPPPAITAFTLRYNSDG